MPPAPRDAVAGKAPTEGGGYGEGAGPRPAGTSGNAGFCPRGVSATALRQKGNVLLISIRAMARKRLAAAALAGLLSVGALTAAGEAAQAQAQDDAESRRTNEQGFDKWGQLLGLAGLAGLGGLALQRTDKKNDDQ